MKHITPCLVALFAAAAPVFGAPSNYHDANQPGNRAIEDYPLDDISKSSCDDADLYVERVPFGNNEGGGGFFCVSKWRRGVLPRRIEARADENMLRWLKISYTDGSEVEHGQHIDLDWHQRGGVVEWDPYVDSFSKFEIAGGGWNGGVGRLVAEIAGKGMDAGGWNVGELQDVPRGNGGVLLGFEVRAGDGIDWIRPMFAVSKIERVKLVEGTFDPTYEQLNEKPYSERQMRALHATHHYDNTKSESAGKLIIESSMSTEEGVAVSDVTEDGTENSHEVGGGLHAEVSWEVGIPKIGNAGSKISPEVAYKYTHTKIDKTVKSTEDRDAWSTTVRYRSEHDVKPNAAVTCTVVVLQSHVNLTFTSILQWIFKDGKTHNFKHPGDVKGDDFWDLSAQVADDKAQTMNQFELDPATFTEITSTECGSEGSHFCAAA
ncbi:hypothetical protein LIA77_02747 [Sarocladium implicatum]|nr:hypothetical protein LIA77_02747 [Sarocladium implicatum]